MEINATLTLRQGMRPGIILPLNKYAKGAEIKLTAFSKAARKMPYHPLDKRILELIQHCPGIEFGEHIPPFLCEHFLYSPFGSFIEAKLEGQLYNL